MIKRGKFIKNILIGASYLIITPKMLLNAKEINKMDYSVIDNFRNTFIDTLVCNHVFKKEQVDLVYTYLHEYNMELDNRWDDVVKKSVKKTKQKDGMMYVAWTKEIRRDNVMCFSFPTKIFKHSDGKNAMLIISDLKARNYNKGNIVEFESKGVVVMKDPDDMSWDVKRFLKTGTPWCYNNTIKCNLNRRDDGKENNIQ